MKLKFSIRYRTAWGESLHVALQFHNQDGTVRSQNLTMQTEDGELWTLETVAMASRHHPQSHIVYRYMVENADGQVLRQEWDMVPRIYHFDASQDYLFPDQWRDRPLPGHLYSDAYLTTTHGHRGEQVEVARAEETWRAAGVAIPVFSLRSEHSFGVGDFGDLRRFVDWAVATGMKFIQVLPVNDTTTDGRWHDSYPYNIVSMFALHPHYVDLEAAGTLRSKTQMTKFLRRRQELNALPYSDYEAVDRVKTEYLQMLFEEQGHSVLDSKEFKTFVADNEDWLKPYAEWNEKRTQKRALCLTTSITSSSSCTSS